MSVAWIPRIGSEFAGYKLDSLIGHGGMSIVYRAEHLSLERIVALKLLAPQLSEDEAFRERFLRESRMAAGLDHPNVIPIFEAGESDGVFFIAMRYVDGTDLKTHLKNEGPLDARSTVSIINQTASALGAAHAKDLVHRDVKPANILIASSYGVDESNHIYLSDFGVVKHAASRALTQTGMFVGTAEYASPEQIEGKPLDGRADVYSLACVVYECLTGAPAYDKDSEVALMYAHLLEPPPSAVEKRPDLPPEIDDVIAKGMAKSRDDRYATPRELAAAVRDVLGAGMTVAPASGATQLATPAPGETVLAGAPPTGVSPPAAGTQSPPAVPPQDGQTAAAPPGPPAAPARSGGGGGMGRRAKVLLVAGIVAALAAGGAVAGVLLTRDSGGGSGGTGGGQTQELTLLSALLPKQIGKSCTARSTPASGAVETAVCTPPANGSGFYPEQWEVSFYATDSAMTDAYDQLKSDAGLTQDQGRCDRTSWGGEGTWAHGPGEPAAGRRFCTFEGDNAVIVWTHQKKKGSEPQPTHMDIVAKAREGGSDHVGLFNWWRFWHHDVGKCVSTVSEQQCVDSIAEVEK